MNQWIYQPANLLIFLYYYIFFTAYQKGPEGKTLEFLTVYGNGDL